MMYFQSVKDGSEKLELKIYNEWLIPGDLITLCK